MECRSVEEFIGFQDIINNFIKRVRADNLSHAHLVVGPDGIGKSILAKIFALNILGKKDNRDYIDIVNYRPKKASFGVDEVREVIEEINKKPVEGNRKVIIIHNGDKLTVQAQNALLKTIEEPPRGVFIIILTESLELMLDTIKSRSQIYKLTSLKKEDMIKFIKRFKDIQEDDMLVALSFSEGVPGRAIRILKDENLRNLRNSIVSLLKDIGNGNELLQYELKLEKYKSEKQEVINTIALFIRDIMLCRELQDKNKVINADKYNDICELANLYSYNKLNSMLETINKARTNLLSNVSYSMVISTMLIGFLED